MNDTPTETDQIEHELAETRSRMDRRLDELGNKLAPSQLVNDTLAQVSGSNGAEFAQTLIAKAKANPIPAALTGIGVAWLMASSQTKQPKAKPDLPTRLRFAEAGVIQLDDEHSDVHASRVDDVRGQVLGIARSASDTAASYAQRIKVAMASASETVTQSAQNLGIENRGGLKTLASNPIILGAGAAIIGLVTGALVPVSDAEEHALGNVADQLRDKGLTAAQDITNRGAQVAGETLDAVKDSAEAHGLTTDRPVGELLSDLRSGELVEQMKQAVSDVVDASKESLHSQIDPAGKSEG